MPNPLGPALTGTSQTPIYTGNNVSIQFNGFTIGLVQTLTLDASTGATLAHQVGTNLAADVYDTAASVTVTCTKFVPIPQDGIATLVTNGILPSGSLASALSMAPFTMTIVDSSGNQVYTVKNAKLSTDSLSISANAPLSDNVTFIATDYSPNY